jgi:asparaginyl-tRNA synthetase
MSEKRTNLQKASTIVEDDTVKMPQPLERLSEEELKRKQCISRVMTHSLRYLTCKFSENGFEWLLPVIFSPCTDPLWPDPGASVEKRVEVEIYEKTVRTTLSMIIHKIIACSLAYPKLFILSPNVRIEKRERANSGINAYEFTQLDFEIRDATAKDIRKLVEDSICGLVGSLQKNTGEELKLLGRYHDLKTLEKPFKVYDAKKLESKYGKDWEKQIITESCEPVWVTNIPREFYDFEDMENGVWDNYDLLLPKYGEVLSGAKREHEYAKMVKKIERDSVKKENYQLLLKLAKDGRIKPSAGAGIGVERLVGWIVGAKHVGETQPFPKIPGIVYDL